jgi:DNA-directed RNA polymerase specialized sigma24 family protein
MGDRPKPTPLILALTTARTLFARLARTAARRLRRPQDAEDAAQHAMKIALEREITIFCWYDRGRLSPVGKYIFRILRGVMATWNRIADRSRLDATMDLDALTTLLSHEEREADLAERAARDRIADELEAELAKHPLGRLAGLMIKAGQEGIDGHEDMADYLEVKVEDVRKAQRLITDHAKKLVEEHRRARAREELTA